MEMYCLSRKALNFRRFPFPHYSLSSLLFSPTPQTLLSPNPPLPLILSFRQFGSNSSPDSSTASISKTGSFSLFCTANPSSQNFSLFNFRWFRSFSVSSSVINVRRTEILKIMSLIRKGQSDLESELDGMNVSLSAESIKLIFRGLNRQSVSALRFFDWIRQSHPQFVYNTEICSLVIDNCVRLDNLESMFSLLDDFKIRGICLNRNALGYLPVMISKKPKMKDRLCEVIEVLNRVGGASGISGISSFIEKFSSLGCKEMTYYVIAKTEASLSNYNVLIRASCRRGNSEEAKMVLDRMIKVGCRPNSHTFNCILSCLCKNDNLAEACQLLEKMEECGYTPGALTFEIFVSYSCRIGRLDMASEWLDKMISRGVEPRITTHAAIIRGYFKLQQYEEAHNYVVVCSDKYKKVSNEVYSLLAELHRRRGEPVIAQNILSEMIEKGLKPNFRVYTAVRNELGDLQEA